MRWNEIFEEDKWKRGKILPKGNVVGENVFHLSSEKRSSLNGQIAYHQTSKKNIPKIEAFGGLKPQFDRSGEREFALDALKAGKDWRTPKGIFVSTGKPDWVGDVTLSFIITSDDNLLHAYTDSGWIMITNPVSWDRITVET